MKVMLVITKGEHGGAQTHVFTLCQALKEQVQLIVATGGLQTESALAEQLAKLHIPVCQLRQLHNTLSPLRLARAIWELVRLLRQQQPDILHAHSAVAGVVARIAGLFVKIPVVYTVHGFGFKPEVSGLKRHMSWLAEYVLARFTHRMICVSHHEHQLACQLPISTHHLSVIHNGLADSDARAQANQRDISIAMVARFAPPKRPDLLLEALALVRDQLGYEIPTTLIGDGPTLESNRTLAHHLQLQALTFTGDVDDVTQRLATHSIFVLMSDHEGLPISVIEAMRAGLCIVASDLPGLRELLVPDISGLLVPNQATALAAALIKLEESAELRTQLSHAARLRYESDFTAAHMTQSVVAIYSEFAHGQRTH